MDGKQFWTGRHCRTAEFFGGRRDRSFKLRCVDEWKEKAHAGCRRKNLWGGGLHQQCGKYPDQCDECHDRCGEPSGHGDGDHRKCPWCWRKGCLWQRWLEPDGRHWCCGRKTGRRLYVVTWHIRPRHHEPGHDGCGGFSAGRSFRGRSYHHRADFRRGRPCCI